MKNLIAEKFFSDPDLLNAQEALINTLEKHQSAITTVKPPHPDLKKSYQDTLNSFADVRGASLFYPYVASGIGNGPLIELEDGSVKYDFISGIGVHHFGHSHPQITLASIKAALADTVMQGHLQQTTHSLNFSKKLLKLAQSGGAKLDHCFLSTTGVMAGENALKMAFQKKHPASRILAYKNCFAGRTITFAQITDKPAYRDGIPLNTPVDYVPFWNPENPEQSSQDALNTLKTHLERYPNQHAAMFFELIQGEGGFHHAPAEFHRSLMQICKEHNVPVLVDEVQSFSRTTHPFAFQYYGLDDLVDIVWVGKATQVCATLYKKEFQPRPGLVAQTFTSSTTAIAAGEVILDILTNENYFGPNGKIQELHDHFVMHLKRFEESHPDMVSGPYGIGSMIAFTPFDGDFNKAKEIIHKLFENGVISFIAGKNPTRVRFLIPIGATEKHHIDEAVKIIEDTLLSLA